MKTRRLLVINPNSTEAVTRGISESLEFLRPASGPAIDCLTLPEGPPGIETAAHIEAVVAPLLRLMEMTPASAYVIACFSDPGLGAARSARREPVYGIAESAFKQARKLGERFGIVAIREESAMRHQRYVKELGHAQNFTESLPVGLGVTDLLDPNRARGRLLEVGRCLRDEKGAEALVLGCTGMAPYRDDLAETLGIPVVEPCQAAVQEAFDNMAV